MRQYVAASLTVARRDFMAIVATPSFLIFLLAPLLFLGLGFGMSFGSVAIKDASRSSHHLLIMMPVDDLMQIKQADDHLRRNFPALTDAPPIRLETIAPPQSDYAAIYNQKHSTTLALMHGDLERPILLVREENNRSSQYLNLLVQHAKSLNTARAASAAGSIVQIIPYPTKAREGRGFQASQGIALGAITAIFMLTLLLATQSISSIAEEKSNKVIEILAAAVPLESVFIGKLLAMLGVGILFVAFWIFLLLFGASGIGIWHGLTQASASITAAALDLPQIAPAVGWPAFTGLSVLYMVTNFLLYGSLFLGLGALAATPREIQMLSFPVTILQMFAYFLSLATIGLKSNDHWRTVAEIFPFTSPYAMVAKAALEPNLTWHLMAIAWQALWIAIVISISVRLFRSGVLGSDKAWKFWVRS